MSSRHDGVAVAIVVPMAMFGKRDRNDAQDRPIDPEELRRAVDEGFLIARSAITIAVANRIIMNALQDHATFDAEAVAETAREELARMAAEQVADAERMRELRAMAQKAKGRSKHQHDYKRGDDHRLGMREATFEELARLLEERRGDRAFVDRLVIAARERAWNDIGGTVVGRLGWAARPADDYDIGREERIQQLLDEDFAALVDEYGAPTSSAEDGAPTPPAAGQAR